MKSIPFPPTPLGLSPTWPWARLTLGCISVAITSWNWTHGLNLSWKKDHESLLTCWLQHTFLGPGLGSEVGQSTIWGILWASWLRRSKQSLLLFCPPRNRGERSMPRLSCSSVWQVSSAHLHSSPSPPLAVHILLSLASVPGSLCSFSVTFPPSVSPLVFLPTGDLALAHLSDSGYFLFLFSDNRQGTGVIVTLVTLVAR